MNIKKKLCLLISLACVAVVLASACLLAGCGAKTATFAVNDGVISTEGNYSVAATLEGGSGRASIETPVNINVLGTTMTATIVWSSSNYDLMVVDGVEYLPVSTSGNATFEIPIDDLEKPLVFQAETTAMSTTHMIDYTITFDVLSIKVA